MSYLYTLEKIFLGFFQTSISVSCFIAIYFILMKIFDSQIKVRLRYMLWILIVLRLLMPMSFHIDMGSVINKINQNHTINNTVSYENNTQTNLKSMGNLKSSINISNSKHDSKVQKDYDRLFESIISSCSIIWILGAAVVLSIIFMSSLRFKFKLKKSMLCSDKKLCLICDEIKSKLNIKRNIKVYVCENIESPCIAGVLNSKIYMPNFIYQFNDDDIEYMLLHELVHYKMKDLYLNIISILALSIHWFNPLVWISINKIEGLREYACDAGVLEFLGEEKNIEYGMTLINFSKFFINKNEYSKLSIGFETNNKIGERIKMIKGFKKGSYKMTGKTALGCLVAAVVVFTNGVNVSALDTGRLSGVSSVQSVSQLNNSFLVDAKIKNYNCIDIDKVTKIAGYKFKVPDYIIDGNSLGGYVIQKLSTGNNSVSISFGGKDDDKDNFSIVVLKDNPVESLKEIKENRIHDLYDIFNDNLVADDKTKVDEQEVTIGDVKGKNVEVTVTKLEDNSGKERIPETKFYSKYFLWENSGVYYAIEYNYGEEDESEHNDWTNISQDEVGKIAQSLKDVSDINNVDYHKNSTMVSSIYDKEDLQKAEKILGFNPKVSLKVSDNFVLYDLDVYPTFDSFNRDSDEVLVLDPENKNINYALRSSYKDGDNEVAFFQSKHDTLNMFKQIKANGYFENEDGKINADKVEIDGKDIYKYETSDTIEGKTSKTINYTWEDNGIYYLVYVSDTNDNQDNIVKEFINSKSME